MSNGFPNPLLKHADNGCRSNWLPNAFATSAACNIGRHRPILTTFKNQMATRTSTQGDDAIDEFIAAVYGATRPPDLVRPTMWRKRGLTAGVPVKHWELVAGSGVTSSRARHHGLSRLPPVDHRWGVGMGAPSTQVLGAKTFHRDP